MHKFAPPRRRNKSQPWTSMNSCVTCYSCHGGAACSGLATETCAAMHADQERSTLTGMKPLQNSMPVQLFSRASQNCVASCPYHLQFHHFCSQKALVNNKIRSLWMSLIMRAQKIGNTGQMSVQAITQPRRELTRNMITYQPLLTSTLDPRT